MTTDYLERYINGAGSGWCQKYVLIAVVEDEEGDQSFFVQCRQDQTAAETIGLCEAVSHIQKTKISQAWIAREMDDPDED